MEKLYPINISIEAGLRLENHTQHQKYKNFKDLGYYVQFNLSSHWFKYDLLEAEWIKNKTHIRSIIKSDGSAEIPEELLKDPGNLYVLVCGTSFFNGKERYKLVSDPVKVLKVTIPR